MNDVAALLSGAKFGRTTGNTASTSSTGDAASNQKAEEAAIRMLRAVRSQLVL